MTFLLMLITCLNELHTRARLAFHLAQVLAIATDDQADKSGLDPDRLGLAIIRTEASRRIL